MQARCELTQTNAKPFLTLLEHLNARRYNALASVAGERLREGAPSRSSAKRRSATNIQQHSELLELFGVDFPRQGPKSVRTHRDNDNQRKRPQNLSDSKRTIKITTSNNHF